MSRKREAAERQRIFLVDDHPIVLSGFTLLLNAQPDLTVCGTAPNAEQARADIARLLPALVITDITLPGRNGIELVKDLAVEQPGIPVLVVSMHDELYYAERALRAGARGYLMKEAGAEAMLDAIRRVLAGEIFVSPRMQAQILSAMTGSRPRGSDSPIQKLSDREFEIFRLLGEGRSTKEIAAQLHLSHKTVAVHRGHIKEKLGITSAAELMHQAVRWVGSQG